MTDAPPAHPTTARPILEVRGLSVNFGSQPVLRDLDLKVFPGETLVIIGESGCGKTVLLKTLIGLVPPTRGEVRFDGQPLHQLSEQQLTRQRLRFGFVFQGAALFDSLTIFENVAFPLREHRQQTEAQLHDMVKERLRVVGLSPTILQRKPAELSGGMRKRVGLARAIALDPEVMLYDEPTTGLDPIMSDVINELILRDRARRPVTSIVVTHDMKSALKVGTRIVMLYPLTRLNGRTSQIIYDGSASNIEKTDDPMIRSFVHGEAGDRLSELAAEH